MHIFCYIYAMIVTAENSIFHQEYILQSVQFTIKFALNCNTLFHKITVYIV